MSFWSKVKWLVKGVLTEDDWEWFKKGQQNADKSSQLRSEDDGKLLDVVYKTGEKADPTKINEEFSKKIKREVEEYRKKAVSKRKTILVEKVKKIAFAQNRDLPLSKPISEIKNPPKNKIVEKQEEQKVSFSAVTPERHRSTPPERHHAAPRVRKPRPQRESSRAIVGVDFGTSYTKAYCNIAGWDQFAIRFDVDGAKQLFLPSVVYYDKQTNQLCFTKEQGLHKIEYFKYGLLNKNLHVTDVIREQNANISVSLDTICSVFFMAHVVKLIKQAVKRECGKDDVHFSFNMGCPLDNFSDVAKGEFDLVLNVANKLSDEELEKRMDVGKICEFVKRNKTHKDPSLETIPELYAEALWFIEKPSVGEGIYTILDVGGGTADCATISIKWTNGEKKARIYSQRVAPLGVEVLLNELFPQEIHENRDDCVMNLKKKDVVIPSYSKDKPLTEKIHKLGIEFQKAFFGGLIEVRDKDPKLMKEKWKDGRGHITYYSFGGGADYNWYHSIIKYHSEYAVNHGIPKLEKKLSVKDVSEPRLIIAQQLSRPYFPEIDGFPWDFVEQDPKNSGDDLFGDCDYIYLDT